jgi:hypothetical protein
VTSGVLPALIWVGWIRIQEDKNDPQKNEEISSFAALDISFDALYGGLVIIKLQLLIKKV